MSENWDEYAEGWDNNDSTVLYASKAYASLLVNAEIAGVSVLDFGCGTGLLTQRIADQAASVVALDPSKKMISVLEKKHLKNVSTIDQVLSQHLMNTHKSLQNGFDVIVASSALAFVPDYQQTLIQLKSLLNKGGSFIQWDWLAEGEGEENSFTQESIQLALKNAGFSDYSTSIAFSMQDQNGDLQVVIGVGRNI